MIGEIGGPQEVAAGEFAKDNMKKPVIAYIAGLTAPKGRVMGHAGAIVSAYGESAVEKVELLKECGVTISKNPSVMGETVKQVLDWEKRYLHMRMHTALHLLSVVIPLPVTGGAIRPEKGRLDFDMPNSPEDKEILSVKINKLIDQNFNVTEKMISEVELDNNQNLIKTMSVKPPKGVGQIRLIRIGLEKEQIDLQPCGGTHVKNTNEIGKVKISKIEKKGKLNRRVHIVFD